jgi:hypothetical protein
VLSAGHTKTAQPRDFPEPSEDRKQKARIEEGTNYEIKVNAKQIQFALTTNTRNNIIAMRLHQFVALVGLGYLVITANSSSANARSMVHQNGENITQEDYWGSNYDSDVNHFQTENHNKDDEGDSDGDNSRREFYWEEEESQFIKKHAKLIAYIPKPFALLSMICSYVMIREVVVDHKTKPTQEGQYRA